MPTRDTPFAPGTPCWVDLLSSDVEKSKTFYGGLFGWTPETAGDEFGGYVTMHADGYAVAGVMGRMPGMEAPDGWSTYISTADLDATIEAATQSGAQVLSPAMTIGDVGRMALVMDPAGAVVGLWQPLTFFGFTMYNEHNAVTWDEHHSKNFAASLAFYETLFGWSMEKTSDTDDFRYYQGQIDGHTVAGLMDSHAFLPAAASSYWAVYFSVVDADRAVAKAVELGGSVLRPPEDTSFGRVADLVDSTGAGFKVHSTKLASGS
jgi:predicted enzyme related to lactoylglutathione lyase